MTEIGAAVKVRDGAVAGSGSRISSAEPRSNRGGILSSSSVSSRTVK
ncbi:MAG: hypothetical protein HYV14_10100 [Elusimicrobia bacterium]|nr:hypothetical protein [Elusimicrobiota bacterium]